MMSDLSERNINTARVSEDAPGGVLGLKEGELVILPDLIEPAQAAAARAELAADRVDLGALDSAMSATAADRVATGEDRVQTSLDRSAAAATLSAVQDASSEAATQAGNAGVSAAAADTARVAAEVAAAIAQATNGSGFATRAALVGVAPLIAVQMTPGQIIGAGGYTYRRATGAADISDLPGFLPSGNAKPQHFGAVGDGVADDTDAIEAWAIYTGKLRGLFACVIEAEGAFLVKRPITFTRAATGGFRSTFRLSAAKFVCDYNRSEYPHFMMWGDPASLSTYQASYDIEGRIMIQRGPNCQYAPVGIEIYGMAQSSFTRVDTSSWDNVLINLHGPQNVTFNDLIVYFGGFTWGYRNFSGSTYTWNTDLVTRAEGTAAFISDILGKTITLATTQTAQVLRVIERISDTQIRVDRANPSADPAQTEALRTLRTGSCAPRCVAASAVVALDGEMVIDNRLIGLPVAIPRVGTRGGIHFARVVAVNGAARTITLDKPCVTGLDPISSPASETVDMATPALQLLSDKDGIYSNGISQVRFFNLQVETFKGVALAIDDAEFLDFFGCKFHGVQSGYSWDNNAVGAIWGNTISGKFFGECDARYYGQYRFRVADNTQAFAFDVLAGRIGTGEKLLEVATTRDGYNGAIVTFGITSLLGCAAAAMFADLVTDHNLTAPGYYAPETFLKPDQSHQVRHINHNTYGTLGGDFTIGGGKLFYSRTNGLLTAASGFRVQSQAASFEIWDSDNSGNTRIKFTDNGGNIRGEIIHETSTGRITLSVGGVPQIILTERGLNIAKRNGPFADNAAAVAAGLSVGDAYLDATNALKVVV